MTVIAWLERIYSAVIRLSVQETADTTAILQAEANTDVQLNKLGLVVSSSATQIFQQLQQIQNTQTAQGVLIQQIADTLGHQFRSLTLLFFDEQGNQIKEISMFQLTDAGVGSHLFVVPSETDAAGNPVTIDPTKITVGVSDTTAFTVTPNNTTSPIPSPDVKDASGNPVMIAPGGAEVAAVGTAGHLGSFQITVQDTANSIQAQDTITVVAGAATVIGIGGTVV